MEKLLHNLYENSRTTQSVPIIQEESLSRRNESRGTTEIESDMIQRAASMEEGNAKCYRLFAIYLYWSKPSLARAMRDKESLFQHGILLFYFQW